MSSSASTTEDCVEIVPLLSSPWQPSYDIQVNIFMCEPKEAFKEMKKSLPAVLLARFDGIATSLKTDAQSLVTESLTSLSSQYPTCSKRNRTSSIGPIANHHPTTLGLTIAQRWPVVLLIVTLYEDTQSQPLK